MLRGPRTPSNSTRLWGGDGGLTERTMRAACLLPPREEGEGDLDPLSVLVVTAVGKKGDDCVSLLDQVASIIRDQIKI